MDFLLTKCDPGHLREGGAAGIKEVEAREVAEPDGNEQVRQN